MIDSQGYRPNVGIVICNRKGQLLWAKRIKQEAWQFPQGGIKHEESIEQALFRELDEEVGLGPQDVTILHQTQDWLRYRLPENYIRRNQPPVCIGQKQKWFLLGLDVDEERIELAKHAKPEFDNWRWVDYWFPLQHVIDFKRDVYRQALEQLEEPLQRYIDS
ncbi:MAG: RNA pyrophosphohydrolase [SAR86 cluster bacterium]|uniref:RNA pyrophosphohydrolase n=1 Tax=SAR86 cluster bacterium TaxID=2030880 RepID=A0A2A4MST9_9GAMM|nr:MAG: RNA pyrophosphohydrolase [SAR86 cluster bacterium]